MCCCDGTIADLVLVLISPTLINTRWQILAPSENASTQTPAAQLVLGLNPAGCPVTEAAHNWRCQWATDRKQLATLVRNSFHLKSLAKKLLAEVISISMRVNYVVTGMIGQDDPRLLYTRFMQSQCNSSNNIEQFVLRSSLTKLSSVWRQKRSKVMTGLSSGARRNKLYQNELKKPSG